MEYAPSVPACTLCATPVTHVLCALAAGSWLIAGILSIFLVCLAHLNSQSASTPTTASTMRTSSSPSFFVWARLVLRSLFGLSTGMLDQARTSRVTTLRPLPEGLAQASMVRFRGSVFYGVGDTKSPMSQDHGTLYTTTGTAPPRNTSRTGHPGGASVGPFSLRFHA